MEITSSAAAPSITPMSAAVTMFYEPTKTFQQLESRPRSWVPLLLLILSSVALMGWYFSMVDFPWLTDQLTAAMKPDEREIFLSTMTKSFQQLSTLGFIVFMFPFACALMGVYFMIVSKTINHGISFGKGFALSAWSTIPSLLLLPLGAMQIMLNPAGQFDFSALNPLSLNQLIFHYDMSEPLAGLMDAISLTTFWNMFLLVIGFEEWAKVKRSTAIKVVVLPYVVIFAAWFAIAKAFGA